MKASSARFVIVGRWPYHAEPEGMPEKWDVVERATGRVVSTHKRYYDARNAHAEADLASRGVKDAKTVARRMGN